ncbi:hypothetical protein [Sandaracinus amylolyticus]|uniref:hypothetical protein n=1 Tax=Sandaracinus amylolyticus TaxID=927083 RepID=UPI001F24C3F7|nr:hypothetical protein [Sandaracinus amylolyticus]UJR78505.1 Hypothetical protein I5071_5350 [Sandaracinus amylolyticus]
MRAFWRWTFVLVILGGIALAAALGWIPAALALDAAMGAVALVGLFALVRLPWDLYFQARALVVEQRESVARGIAVSDADRASAAAVASRLLVLCVSLHGIAAAVLAVASAVTGGRVGYAFAAFYLLAIVLRPIEAGYRHVAERLAGMRERARYPREDVMRWVDVVRALELARDEHVRRFEAIDARFDATSVAIRESDERARGQERALDAKLDRVLAELERTIARVSEDRELVAGLRALARLLRTAG